MSLIIKQGEDKYISFNLRNRDTSNIVDLSGLNDVIATFTAQKADLVKYSYLEQTNYNSLYLITGSNEVTLKLDRDDTKYFPIGSVQLNVLTNEDDPLEVSGSINTEYVFTDFIEVQEGLTKNEVL